MLQYCLEVSIAWLIFYLIYLLFLRKETFFGANRWYLIHTLWIGALLPIIRTIPISFSSSENLLYDSAYYVALGTHTIVESVTHVEQNFIEVDGIIKTIYLIGVLLTSFPVSYTHLTLPTTPYV